MQQFMKYWLPKTVDMVLEEEDSAMTYSASNQYNRVEVGDEIWGVVVRPGDKHLMLFGHMRVDWKGNKNSAALRVQLPEDDMWDAELYLISDTPEPFALIDISQYAHKIRFISNTSDRLDVQDGEVDAKQLQTMRELETKSAHLLRDIWYDVNYSIDNTQSFTEGQRKLRLHVYRERNQHLVNTAKNRFKKTYGHLFCEVCNFNFTETYGDLGSNFIEAHHRTPLSEIDGEVINTASDLAMVCANCHRMLHRRKPWLSVEELKILLEL